MEQKIKVVLYLDVYSFTGNSERFWQRQIWVGEVPAMEDVSQYDPLLLQKEGGFDGDAHVFFRLDEYFEEKRTVTYHPVAIPSTSWFMKALPHFGFKCEQIGEEKPVRVRVTHYITGGKNA